MQKTKHLTIVVSAILVATLDQPALSQVVLYDNLANVRGNDWITGLGSDRRFAQQFLIGDSTNIDQVTVQLQRPTGGATGSLGFELWRDNGSGQPVAIDDPTGKIADLGKVLDITHIPVGEFAEYTLDNLIVGLEPNEPYWVVTNFSDVQNIRGEEQSVGFSLIVVAPDHPAPPGYNPLAGTHGAAYLHAYRDQDPFWADLKRTFGIDHLFQAMTVEAMADSKPADDVIYDNSATRLRSGDRILPSPGDTFLAQALNLGMHDTISAAHINLSRTGSVSGTVRLSLWDDNGSGFPGQEIGELGTIDAAELEDVGARPEVIPQVTFDTAVTGLTPNETYFVVADVRELNVSGTAQNPNSVVFAGLRNPVGTNEANEWLAAQPNREPPFAERDWTSFTAFGFGRRWMQLAVEASPVSVFGDLNHNGTLDTRDIDILTSAIRQGLTDTRYDLNQDGQIDADDRTQWISSPEIGNTYFGDSNFDGEFNSSDLTAVFQAGEYRDNISLNSSWSEGDWNGDGDFESGDLIAAFQDGGYDAGPRVDAPAVPEPSSAILLMIGIIVASRSRRSG